MRKRLKKEIIKIVSKKKEKEELGRHYSDAIVIELKLAISVESFFGEHRERGDGRKTEEERENRKARGPLPSSRRSRNLIPK